MPKLRDVYNDCSKCKLNYQLTKETALLHWYKKRPYLCNLEMVCPECEWVEMIFVDEENRELFFSYDWPRKVHEDGEDWLIEGWEKLNYKLEVPDEELIPRHEGLVWDLSILLDATPMEWLMEIFSWPPPKRSMPPKWR